VIEYARIGAGRVRTPEETQQRARAALNLWLRGDYIEPGSLASRYLLQRAIGWLASKRFRHVLRWTPCARHPSGIELPAILCAVTDANGSFRAVHRIYLHHDRPAKFGPPASFGPIAGHAIRLATLEQVVAAGVLIVGEGLETVASACALLRQPGWSAIACGNLARSLILPAEIQNVTIAVDRDPEGERAAKTTARRWRAEGRTVRFLVPSEPGDDANDVLRSGGTV
jgi:putative DNA primase/helicase